MSPNKIDKLRAIVEHGQYAKVDGVSVDAVTAAAILAAYEALSSDKQAVYLTWHVTKMAQLAWKVVRPA